MRTSTSRSISANSASVISPSSSCICASSSCSRSDESTCDSASAAATILSRTKRRLPIKSESRMNTVSGYGLWALAEARQSLEPVALSPFEFQSNIDEVVRRPRPSVLEGQLVEAARDRLDLGVEGLFLIARDEKCGVHDHLVADRLVDA